MGEEVIKCYYCAKGSTVIDVSADKEYQNKDIDFIIDGQTVEVKTQNGIVNYGDVVLELVSNTDNARFKDGWFNTTQADVLIFYSPQYKVMYRVETQKLREWYAQNKYTLQKMYRVQLECGSYVKESYLAFLPIGKLSMIDSYSAVWFDF